MDGVTELGFRKGMEDDPTPPSFPLGGFRSLCEELSTHTS